MLFKFHLFCLWFHTDLFTYSILFVFWTKSRVLFGADSSRTPNWWRSCEPLSRLADTLGFYDFFVGRRKLRSSWMIPMDIVTFLCFKAVKAIKTTKQLAVLACLSCWPGLEGEAWWGTSNFFWGARPQYAQYPLWKSMKCNPHVNPSSDLPKFTNTFGSPWWPIKAMVSLPNCLAKASGKCAFKVIERLLPDHGTSFRVWNGLQIRSILWHFAMVVALQDKCPWEHAGTMNIGWDWGDIRTLSSPRLPSKWLGCRIFCNGSCFFPFNQSIELGSRIPHQTSKVILRFLTPIGDGGTQRWLRAANWPCTIEPIVLGI